jgi:hypothetical protein
VRAAARGIFLAYDRLLSYRPLEESNGVCPSPAT